MIPIIVAAIIVLAVLAIFAVALAGAGASRAIQGGDWYFDRETAGALGGAAKKQDQAALVLTPIGPEHEARIVEITGQKETMRTVGNGRRWNPKKVGRFIGYSVREREEGDARLNFYWGVSEPADPDRVLGVVGIHPVSYGKPETEGKFFVTVYFDKAETGRGLGGRAVSQALGLFREARGANPSDVFADVREDNERSVKMFEKAGFTRAGTATLRGKEVLRFAAPGNA